jgi:hypothetical protein
MRNESRRQPERKDARRFPTAEPHTILQRGKEGFERDFSLLEDFGERRPFDRLVGGHGDLRRPVWKR